MRTWIWKAGALFVATILSTGCALPLAAKAELATGSSASGNCRADDSVVEGYLRFGEVASALNYLLASGCGEAERLARFQKAREKVVKEQIADAKKAAAERAKAEPKPSPVP